jgi:hypothetical protein
MNERRRQILEVVFFEAVGLAADSVSYFSHPLAAVFLNVFLPFCRELKVA